jgi:hypothetical protein
MLVSIQNILDRKGAEVFTIEPTATVRTAAQLMDAVDRPKHVGGPWGG